MPKIFLLGLVVVVIVGGLCIWPAVSFTLNLSKFNAERQKQLLYSIDHAVLAQEVRDFSARHQSATKSTQHPIQFVANDLALPASIRLLKPNSIDAYANSTKLEFGGALLHYGIEVFNVGERGSGTKLLDDGVWFYSENGRFPAK